MINSPCYKCADRVLGCHADCVRYVLDAWEQDNNVTPTCGPDYCEID